MTFFITGLICWGYVLAGEVKSGTDMLILTFVPVAIIAFICTKSKKEPGPVGQSMLGQVILAGVCNGILMFLLEDAGVYIGIPLNVILMVLVLYTRASKVFRKRRRYPNAYQRGYQDGQATARSRKNDARGPINSIRNV